MRRLLVPLSRSMSPRQIGILSIGLAAVGAITAAAVAQTAPSPAPTAQGGAPGNGYAVGGRHRGMGMIQRADANGDGTITKAEMLAESDARFARMDTNKDGSLSADDGGRAGRRGRTVTKEMFHARAAAMFDRIDTNHDGRIDQAELAARMASRAAPDTPPAAAGDVE